MTSIHENLTDIIDKYLPLLNDIPESSFSYKPVITKWSKKEIIGHLVDSAHNNIRRFIVAQYEVKPHIIYNQDKWVAINNYQQANSKELIQLWCLLNKQLCSIIRNTSAEILQQTALTNELHTIEWLATDYIKHLLHHLHVVLELEPIAYP